MCVKLATKTEPSAQSKEKKEKNERKITALLMGKLQVGQIQKFQKLTKKSSCGLTIPEVDKYLNVK